MQNLESNNTLKYIVQKFNLDKYVDENWIPQSPIAFRANTPDGVLYQPKREIRLENFTRDDLAKLFAELGFKVGVEIGVERANYSEVLCKANPSMLLYGVDPLIPYHGYREHVSKEKMDGFYEEVVSKMSEHNFKHVRKFSLDAVKDFKDGSLDFVYIDGNHDFQNTTNDIVEWSKKVRKGGIIAGHDYNRNKKKDYRCHVKDVVQGYTYALDIKPYFITSDKSPSWFWVNQ